MAELDDTDAEILRLLLDDGRRSYTEIGESRSLFAQQRHAAVVHDDTVPAFGGLPTNDAGHALRVSEDS